MIKVSPFVIALILSAAVPAVQVWPALGDDGADANGGNAEIGRNVADAVCSECHAIEPGGRISPDADAPPFARMMTSQHLTPSVLEGWLTSSHALMPDVVLPEQRRADLIAYIESLALKP